MPKVSICIPTFNQTEYLEKTLNSIFQQEYLDYEIIVSDDSTENTVFDLIEKYRWLGYYIRYYKNSVPLGSPKNWNNAIEKADGEFIKVIHHDDWFTSSKSLGSFVSFFEQNNKLGFVFSGSKISDPSGKIRFHQMSDAQFLYLRQNPSSLYRANLIGAPSAVMYRKNLNVRFDITLKWLVDIEFYFQILKKGVDYSFASEHLIETYIPPERITNSCHMNKYVEIPEHFYFMEKHKIKDYKNLNYLVELCIKLEVYTITEIRNCGYSGKINLWIPILLSLKKGSLYKIYSKLIFKLKPLNA